MVKNWVKVCATMNLKICSLHNISAVTTSVKTIQKIFLIIGSKMWKNTKTDIDLWDIIVIYKMKETVLLTVVCHSYDFLLLLFFYYIFDLHNLNFYT